MSYMVSVTGGAAPSKIHETLDEAKAEAERISEQTKNRFSTIHVLKVVAALEPRMSHEWRDAP